jgi:hypothetical protein
MVWSLFALSFEQGMIAHIATRFRFLVKQVLQRTNAGPDMYDWYEMGFVSLWKSTDVNVIICFDAPAPFQIGLQNALCSSPVKPDLSEAYSMHVLIVQEVINLFDGSVWALRDAIRSIEMVRLSLLFGSKSTG